MDLTDATTVMAQLPEVFEHFKNVHPHSSLRMRSPREFRQHRQRVAPTGRASTSAARVAKDRTWFQLDADWTWTRNDLRR